ncbi:contractile injection system tape measure protein [Enterobacteriaceae bacterium LUAb1]
MSIDKVIIEVNATHYLSGKALLRSSVFYADNIKSIANRVIQQSRLSGLQNIKQCVLHLGTLSAAQFEEQFNRRLAKSLREYLHGLQQAPAYLLASSHLADDSPAPTVLLTDADQDRAARRALAIRCLLPEQQRRILHNLPPEQRRRLLQQLLRGTSALLSAPAVQATGRMTGNGLTMAALICLVQDREGVRWLSEHPPDITQLQRWTEAVASGEINAEQITALLRCRPLSAAWQRVARGWLLPLWQRKIVRDTVRKQAGKRAAEKIAADLTAFLQPVAGQSMPVSNAGLVLLWPLLPQLFSLLELSTEHGFVSEDARWQAVMCLDWLAWGATPPTAGQLTVNRLLCGLPFEVPLPELLPLTPQQQQLTDDWLAAVSHQVAVWQRFSLADIRQLFLQRPGEIIMQTQPPQISVQPASFDMLLGDWPWPLTLVMFPWQEQPLTLIWPLPHHTG